MEERKTKTRFFLPSDLSVRAQARRGAIFHRFIENREIKNDPKETL
jgi:hypothetical protein